MTFRNWKIWYYSQPVVFKWFIILILLRPFIDLFYFLKDLSPFISPLYIVGFLTPILIIWSFLSRRFPGKEKSALVDSTFMAFSLVVGLNLLILLTIDAGFKEVGEIFKFLTPLLFFFYTRRFIKNRLNLVGVLQTFFYSALVPGALLLYELIFEPINVEYLSAGRGGGARIQGGYADIMNYAIYIAAALLIKSYMFIRDVYEKRVNIKKVLNLIMVVAVCFMGLVAIKQTASWGVIGAILLLFILFNLNNSKGVLLIIFLTPIILFVAQQTYQSKIKPLVEKEIRVIEGDAHIDRSFNGRMTRWKKYFEIWEDMPISSNLLGASMSGQKITYIMVSGGMHSDYVRILFLGGLAGFLFYIGFLVSLLGRVSHLKLPEKFLLLGALATIFLYSVSTTPILYAPIWYYIFPIFAYASLPKSTLKNDF